MICPGITAINIVLSLNIPMLLPLVVMALVGVFLKALHRYYFNFAARALDDIPGPSSDSWLFGESYSFINCMISLMRGTGNLWIMLRGEAGAQEIGWHHKYGGVVKLKGPLGVSWF
jgi:hypothetical protein